MLFTLCLLTNLSLGICFKLFPRYRVDTFSAIVLNYWVSLILGSVMIGHIPLLRHLPASYPWTTFAMINGVLFIIGFTIIGISVKKAGMAITTTMQKMSLLLPTTYALLFFHETAGVIKLFGILGCLAAIVLITFKEKTDTAERSSPALILLPLGALLMSGLIETILYHVQAEHLTVHGELAFTAYGFGTAALLGAVILLYRLFSGQYRLTKRDILAGIILGVPNFFSIYLILILLKSGYSGSDFYPIMNTLILALSVLIGLFVFREKLNRVNVIGLIIAGVAILLVSQG